MEVYQEKLPAVYRELHRLHRAALNHVFGAVGMHPGQAMALFLLTQRGMASSLARMENAGLVERYLDGEDSRRKLVYITPRGREEAGRIQKLFKQMDQSVFSGFNPEEAVLLLGCMERMCSNLRGLRPEDFAGEPQKGEGNESNQ